MDLPKRFTHSTKKKTNKNIIKADRIYTWENSDCVLSQILISPSQIQFRLNYEGKNVG